MATIQSLSCVFRGTIMVRELELSAAPLLGSIAAPELLSVESASDA